MLAICMFDVNNAVSMVYMCVCVYEFVKAIQCPDFLVVTCKEKMFKQCCLEGLTSEKLFSMMSC